LNRKQLMVDSYKDIVDGSICKRSTRKPATSNHPAFALLLLAGTLLLLLALAVLPQPTLAATPITACTELQNIRNNLAGDYYLANVIDCSCTSGWNGGKGFLPIGTLSTTFSGTFDGKGYKITHLYINRPSTDNVGLFGFADTGSEIKNVSLEEVDARGRYYVGGLVGVNYEGIITNSYSSGSVSGNHSVGGLVGYNLGTITNSYSTGSVSGSMEVGGLVAYNSGTIENSYSTGSVSGSTEVGGLVAYNSGTIENSYSTGNVSGSVGVGGLVGDNSGIITNSYSSGSVSGSDYVGGLVGYNRNSGTITKSYWDIYRSGRSNCVGEGSSNGCTGKNADNHESNYWYYHTHAPMDQWDFDNIWGIEEGVTYPYLQWQICPCGDICVNTAGWWWRDGGAFNPSSTPIQHAIDNASEGNTICVKDGTYNETVDVTKSHLTIRSENGPSVTTVSASLNPDEDVFSISDQTNVTLKGFEIRDAHGTSQDVAGIYMEHASECNISNNIVTNISITGKYNAYGIYLRSSSGNSFYTTTIYNISAKAHTVTNAYGIYLRSSSGNSFYTTTVYNIFAEAYAETDIFANAYGIYLRSSSDNSFYTTTVYNLSANAHIHGHNHTYANAYGIYLWSSSDNSFHTTTVYNLSAGGIFGIWLYSSSDNSFDRSTVYNLSTRSTQPPFTISLQAASSASGCILQATTRSTEAPFTISFQATTPTASGCILQATTTGSARAAYQTSMLQPGGTFIPMQIHMETGQKTSRLAVSQPRFLSLTRMG
jgi:parallel beta-helix repeat protein